MRSPPRPPLIDALVATGLLVAGVADAAQAQGDRTAISLVALPALAAVPLAWRRSLPLVALACTVAATAVQGGVDGAGTGLVAVVALVLACFTVARELDPPVALLGLMAVAGPWISFATVEGGSASDYVFVGLLYGGAWSFGHARRRRVASEHALAARASALERDREAGARAAVAEERRRIARELHDVVSHSISVVAIQTQAVRRRLPAGLEREADDLRAVETTARQAMAEMRRLFGVLRDDGDPAALAPQPGLDQLDPLIAQARAAGLTVDLVTTGEPVVLPPGVDLAAYRIVQEALTNAMRHAGADQVAVGLDYLGDALVVSVEDDGRGVPGDRDAAGGSGHGLVGMRERVRLYGGTLDIGPARRGPGFRVHARLPVRESRA